MSRSPSAPERAAGRVPRGPVALIGVGLMGGSLGRALLAAGVTEVRAHDPHEGVADQAVALGAATSAAGTLAGACDGASCVVIGAPVPAIPGLARAALAASPDDCLVTDMGSAKRGVVEALTPAQRERFIGGHPICGGERSGVAAGRDDLFRGATWFLTPTAEARPMLFERLHAMIAAVGAVPVAIDAAVHDRLMALVSHVPHVLAAALIHQAAATAPEGREALRSAGPSFQDLTRVAGSNPPLWADILLSNRDAVVEALADFRGRLAEVEGAVARGDRAALLTFVADAAEGRERLRSGGDEPAGEAWAIVTDIPDLPGALSEIATALGHAHINITDLALQPHPPGGVGELVVRVDGAAAAAEAVRLIGERGYTVRAAPV
ncbi:MAG: prephenate dehydrogenase/arogenate dehydrogenase family protein [Thermoleophilia bacterium]|nr:prephenate dehydrogenase/arogenate dehydrogenase family protein [Thermoleophilia bacterium]